MSKSYLFYTEKGLNLILVFSGIENNKIVSSNYLPASTGPRGSKGV